MEKGHPLYTMYSKGCYANFAQNHYQPPTRGNGQAKMDMHIAPNIVDNKMIRHICQTFEFCPWEQNLFRNGSSKKENMRSNILTMSEKQEEHNLKILSPNIFLYNRRHFTQSHVL